MKNLTSAEKLKLARKQKGYKTAAIFARTFNLSEATYRSHENGIRSIPLLTAQKYSHLLQVNWQWLLFNDDNAEQKTNKNLDMLSNFVQSDDSVLSYNLQEKVYNSGHNLGFNTNPNIKSLDSNIKYLPNNFYKNQAVSRDSLDLYKTKNISLPVEFLNNINTNSNLFSFNINFQNYYFPINSNIVFDSNNLEPDTTTANLYLLYRENNLYIKKLNPLPLINNNELLVNYNGVIAKFNELNILGKIIYYSFML